MPASGRSTEETLALIRALQRSVDVLRAYGHLRAAETLIDAISRRFADLPQHEQAAGEAAHE